VTSTLIKFFSNFFFEKEIIFELLLPTYQKTSTERRHSKKMCMFIGKCIVRGLVLLICCISVYQSFKIANDDIAMYIFCVCPISNIIAMVIKYVQELLGLDQFIHYLETSLIIMVPIHQYMINQCLPNNQRGIQCLISFLNLY